jgi:hypothetical protein
MSQDYGPLQPVGSLALYDVMSFIEVRYLSSNEALSRFGLNAQGGPVIVLISTKGQ